MNNYTVEFFKDEFGFHAYIGQEDGSGYDCCGKTKEAVAADTDRDNFLTAKEALTYGIIDQVVDRMPEA